jgi:hypothetical protein
MVSFVDTYISFAINLEVTNTITIPRKSTKNQSIAESAPN